MSEKKSANRKKLSPEEGLWLKSLDLLAHRMHSVSEFRLKLKRKGYDTDLIDTVITNLIDRGYLNDEDYAEVYVNNLIRYKTYGYYSIKSKLMQKGIESGLAQSALERNLSLETEAKLAEKFLGSKRRLLSGSVSKEKAAAALKRRGFRQAVIGTVLE
jgi:regulatory protein